MLNSETQQPIEDASVTLECRRDNLFHGSTILRKVTVSANNAGNYEFSGGDVAGCDFGYVNADKSGYQSSGGIHPGYGYTAYSKIPKITYLTPDSEAVMLRLRYITPTRTGNVHTTDGRYSPGHDYMKWYSGFFQAKRIAQTSREKQFVLVSYCDTLEKLYRLFSNEDKSMVAGYAVTGAGNGRFDHAAVVSYCEDR